VAQYQNIRQSLIDGFIPGYNYPQNRAALQSLLFQPKHYAQLKTNTNINTIIITNATNNRQNHHHLHHSQEQSSPPPPPSQSNHQLEKPKPTTRKNAHHSPHPQPNSLRPHRHRPRPRRLRRRVRRQRLDDHNPASSQLHERLHHHRRALLRDQHPGVPQRRNAASHRLGDLQHAQRP